MTTNEKRALTARPCTLNGEPAVIAGALLRFAIVATLRPSGPRVEYAWPTVVRVLEAGGDFRA